MFEFIPIGSYQSVTMLINGGATNEGKSPNDVTDVKVFGVYMRKAVNISISKK